MSGALQAVFQNQRSFSAPTGQDAYTTPGSYSWVAPAGVTSVSVVCVGGAARCGAGLGYKNNYSVTPSSSYTVVVGAGNAHSSTGNDSYFVSTAVVKGGKPVSQTVGGGYVGDGGGNGGNSNEQGGAGAGGYAGNGGNAGSTSDGENGAGGGGGGGGSNASIPGGGAGGGVGILGQGANGVGGSGTAAGTPGSGGSGKLYGGGGTYPVDGSDFTPGGDGAVRIIWPGSTRTFPSTNTGNL